MSVADVTYDVFLAHTVPDAGIAGAIRRQLSDVGLNVFDATADLSRGSQTEFALQNALAESDAVVVILTPTSATSATLMMELGGAIAWGKPVYVVRDGVSAKNTPDFVRKFESYSASDVASLAKRLVKSRRPTPFTNEQREYLIDQYRMLGTPLDQLPEHYFQLLYLKNALNEHFGAEFTPERVMQELLRLRKQGQLPRLAS
jgi:hypothetical protein